MSIKRLIIFFVIVSFIGTFGQTKTSTKSKTTKAKAPETEQYIPPPPPPPPKDGVVIHITSGLDNPVSVLTGLTKALNLSNDYDVYVFFDVKGPEILLSSSKSLEYKKFEPSKLLVSKLLDKGISVAACSQSLENMNKTQFDLMKGVKIGNKNDFFDFTKGRILTLEY